MNFLSTKDILVFALSKELASAQFYRDIGSRMPNSSTQALFGVLLKNELEHVETIRLEIQKMGYTVEAELEKVPSDYEWQERLEMDDAASEMSFTEALVLGIQKERAAFRLYTQLLGQTQSAENEQILLELAEEEMRHVLQLEHEYESITRHRNP
jgi:rubrerythrin